MSAFCNFRHCYKWLSTQTIGGNTVIESFNQSINSKTLIHLSMKHHCCVLLWEAELFILLWLHMKLFFWWTKNRLKCKFLNINLIIELLCLHLMLSLNNSSIVGSFEHSVIYFMYLTSYLMCSESDFESFESVFAAVGCRVYWHEGRTTCQFREIKAIGTTTIQLSNQFPMNQIL